MVKKELTEIKKLYVKCMNCKETCPKARRDNRKGLVPRAFDICRRGRPKVLVVAKNPGHTIDKFKENKFYIGKRGVQLFRAHLKFREKLFSHFITEKDSSLIFHKNRDRYLRYLLGHVQKLESFDKYLGRLSKFAKDHEKIMQEVAMTNLFKCSTEDERGKLTAKDVSGCFNEYFIEELRILKPRVILALGNEVAKILNRFGKKQKLPPVVKIKHPSYFYERNSEVKELTKIRKSLSAYL